jgi:hypothetical protein
VRKVTNQILEQVQQGLLDKDNLIRDLLGWMSEADVAEFAERNDYVSCHDEEEEDPTLDECRYCGEYCDGECDEALAGGFQEDWGSIGPPS